jgi:hypothetical protein
MTSSELGVEQHNRQTGRSLNGTWEVGCPHSSEEVGERPPSEGGHIGSNTRRQHQPHPEVELW